MVSIYLFLIIYNNRSERNRYKLLKNIEIDEEIDHMFKEDLMQLNKNYVLYENYIVDVSQFMYYHPGGQNLIKENLKQDVTRYVNGSVSLNGNYIPHTHSYLATKHILEKLTIGILKENHQLIIDLNNK